MGLAVLALVGALAVGFAVGGTWTGLLELHLEWRWLIVLAVAVQVLAGVAGRPGGISTRSAYLLGLALSAALAAGFCARNIAVPGIPLVTLGLVANATVVAANGAMPVSIVAAEHAGVGIVEIAAGNDPRHEIAGAGTAYRWLGDVVPVPLPVHPEVVSPGDVLVAAGLGELVVAGMRQRRRRPAEEGGERSGEPVPVA